MYMHDEILSKYMKEFWEDESVVTKKRKDYYVGLMLECIADGKKSKDEIVTYCYDYGLNEPEKQVLFNSWGGLPRYLVESRKIVLNFSNKTTYSLAPTIDIMNRYDAELRQLNTYISTYGPVTIYDMMYFFKWSKSKVLSYLSEIPCNKQKILNDVFYYKEIVKQSFPLDKKVFIFSGFDPFIIGYEKKKSIVLDVSNIRDVFLLQGVIRPTLFYEDRIVGVWWKSKNIVNMKYFEPIEVSVKREFYHEIESLLGNTKLNYVEIE